MLARPLSRPSLRVSAGQPSPDVHAKSVRAPTGPRLLVSAARTGLSSHGTSRPCPLGPLGPFPLARCRCRCRDPLFASRAAGSLPPAEAARRRRGLGPARQRSPPPPWWPLTPLLSLSCLLAFPFFPMPGAIWRLASGGLLDPGKPPKFVASVRGVRFPPRRAGPGRGGGCRGRPGERALRPHGSRAGTRSPTGSRADRPGNGSTDRNVPCPRVARRERDAANAGMPTSCTER